MYRVPPGLEPFAVRGPLSPFGPVMPFAGGFPGRPAGFLSRFLSPTPGKGVNLIGMVENIQKIIKVADSVKPLVQQYGPMVKNLPSMWTLLKEYQSYNSTSDTDTAETNVGNKSADKTLAKFKRPVKNANSKKRETTVKKEKEKTLAKKVKPVVKNKTKKVKKKTQVQKERKNQQQSMPKLYI